MNRNETIKKSKFKNLKVGDQINLELPLKYGQDISGHICQGHVDTTGKILNIKRVDKSYIFDFEINPLRTAFTICSKCLFAIAPEPYL